MGEVRELLIEAVAAQEARRLDQAESAYRRALRLRPHHPEIESRLAGILLAKGKLQTAAATYRRVTRRHPKYAPAHVGMGSIRLVQRQPAAAQTCFQKALLFEPSRVDALFGLALAWEHQGDHQRAAAQYYEVLRVDPQHASAFNNLGNLLRERGESDAAVRCLRRAVELKPTSAAYTANLGLALQEVGKLDEAAQRLEQALTLAPNYLPAMVALAKLYEAQNLVAEAASAASSVLALQPDNLEAERVAAVCQGRCGERRLAIERLRRLLPRAVEHKDQVLVTGELARLLDKEGEYTEAFEYFREANERVLRILGEHAQRKNEIRDEIARLRRVYEQNEPVGGRRFLASSTTESMTAEGLRNHSSPVFLVGFPRSGTTLVEQTLDAHPLVQTLSERGTLTSVKEHVGEKLGQYTDQLPRFPPALIQELSQAYFSAADKYTQRKAGCLLVDKNPLSLRDAGLIVSMFPDARFLIVQRHPYDVCLSCFMQQFTINQATINFLTLHDTATLYREVMSLWELYVRVLPLENHVIRYERLVVDFEATVKEMLDFLGLPFDEAVLRFAQHAAESGHIRTPSYRQVVQPIYQSACDRWRHYRQWLAPIVPLLRPFATASGYATD